MSVLVLSTAVFGDKFRFIELDRYYLPIRPLYFALFVAPICLLPSPVVRAACCAALALAALWIVQVDWLRPYTQAVQADRERTAYGQWARSFTPGASELYARLRTNAALDWIVFSNFHEYLALETGIAALPIPPDVAAFERWTRKIAAERGITNPRTVFVLDRDNRWRDYWIPPVGTIMETFDLQPFDAPGTSNNPYLFTPRGAIGATQPDALISWNSS
jgi:hypothetical protein